MHLHRLRVHAIPCAPLIRVFAWNWRWTPQVPDISVRSIVPRSLALPQPTEPSESAAAVGPFSTPLTIEIDEQTGIVHLQDVRNFVARKRAFCRRFLELISLHPEATRAEVELESSTCRIEFESAWATSKLMAEVVTSAIRQALETAPAEPRITWWQPAGAWSTLTFYSDQDDLSIWETRERRQGAIRFRHASRSGRKARLSRIAQELDAVPLCRNCHLVRWSRRLAIDCEVEGQDSRLILDQVERLRNDVDTELARSHALEAGERAFVVARGPKRWGYMFLGGCSFVMSVIGLIVPGIPTVPFLLATSYCFARSSPALNEMLLDSPFFGDILQEWEEFGGVSNESKLKLAGFTLVVILITVAFAPISPVIMGIVAAISATSLYGIARLPGIDPARNSLPAPAAI